MKILPHLLLLLLPLFAIAQKQNDHDSVFYHRYISSPILSCREFNDTTWETILDYQIYHRSGKDTFMESIYKRIPVVTKLYSIMGVDSAKKLMFVGMFNRPYAVGAVYRFVYYRVIDQYIPLAKK